MPKILIVDDAAAIRRTLSDILLTANYEVDTAEDGKSCLAAVAKCKYDVILLDIKMPRPDGMEVLDILTEKYPAIPVIMISAHGTIDVAVESLKKGAFDYISKPPDFNRLMIVVRSALDKSQITKNVVRPRRSKKNLPPAMIGESPKMLFLKSQIQRTADSDARVLITGSNGSGKELVARNVHYNSSRSSGPFIEVNCAAIPTELIESVLFGHERGSFTGAVKTAKGKFEQAHGGTLFLDEIGDMSLSAQAKVLRALQENKICRVGGDKDIHVDCRIIAATNRNLMDMIDNYTFRDDLYYRLAVVNLEVPALNDRREDIPLLVNHFIKACCQESNKAIREVHPKAMQALQELNYRGNIRELRNIIERLLVLGSPEITEQDVQNLVKVRSNPMYFKVKQLVHQVGSSKNLIAYIEKEFA